jgi:hypothetical protein
VIINLNKFIEKYVWKLPSFGLDPRAFGFLKRDYGGLIIFGVQNVQNIVDDAILSLLSVLFSYEAIKAFGLEDVSNLSILGPEKIEKYNVYNQILATINVLIDHWDPSFGVLGNELETLKRFSHARPLFNHLSLFKRNLMK